VQESPNKKGPQGPAPPGPPGGGPGGFNPHAITDANLYKKPLDAKGNPKDTFYVK